MSALIFLGAGGIGVVAAEIARLMGFEIAGFLDDNLEKHGSEFCGAKVLGTFELLPELRRHGVKQAVISLGSCYGRLRFAEKALACGFALPNLIHPSAIVSSNATIGHGAILMPGTIVNAGSRIGTNVIVNTAASIDHDCTLSDGIHIGPGSRLSGLVTIGTASWIGIGSVVRESIKIGSNTLVGAGSVVVSNIPNDVVAYGCPARIIRANLRAGEGEGSAAGQIR